MVSSHPGTLILVLNWTCTEQAYWNWAWQFYSSYHQNPTWDVWDVGNNIIASHSTSGRLAGRWIGSSIHTKFQLPRWPRSGSNILVRVGGFSIEPALNCQLELSLAKSFFNRHIGNIHQKQPTIVKCRWVSSICAHTTCFREPILSDHELLVVISLNLVS